MKKLSTNLILIGLGLVVLSLAHEAHAAPAFVQSSTAVNAQAGTSFGMTFSTTVTKGDLIIFVDGAFNTSTTNVTDGAGDTYSRCAVSPQVSTNFVDCWYTLTSAPLTTATVFFASGDKLNGVGFDFSGVGALDTASTTTNTASTTASTRTITSTGASDLFFAVNAANNVPTQKAATSTTGGWTDVGFGTAGDYGPVGAAYIIATSSVSLKESWKLGSSQTSANIIVAFLSSAVSGATNALSNSFASLGNGILNVSNTTLKVAGSMLSVQ
jgi:hypothetical protein